MPIWSWRKTGGSPPGVSPGFVGGKGFHRSGGKRKGQRRRRFFGRVICIGNLVFIIAAVDAFDFGMRLSERKSPEGKRHGITSLIRDVIPYHALFHKSRYYKELGEKKYLEGVNSGGVRG
jgi:hypothetical protein